MFKARVHKYLEPSSTVNNGYVILQYDIDDNGYWDNNYVMYMHIDPNNDIYVGKVYTVDQSFGMIDYYKVNGWPTHLHLHDTTSSFSSWSMAYSKKLFKYFRSVKNWGYGYYLDYFAGDSIISNTLYISANSMDNGSNAGVDVEFYYRIGYYGTWQQGPNLDEFMTGNNTGSYYRYKIDLKTATGATTGQTIYFYLAGIRSNGTVSSSYNWGLWPQYYKMPRKKPSEIIADGELPVLETHTIQ